MQRVRIQVRADDPAWLADADQALSLLRSVSDKELELATLEELGYCHLQAGNHTVGIEMLSQHAEALRDRDGVDAYVEAVATVAWEAHEEGATQAALSLLRDAWPRLDSVHAQQEFLESTEHIVTGTPLQPEWERWHAQTHRENTA